MREIDDKMLKQFFNDNKNEVQDNGFSERVMSHLPGKAQRLAKLWTLISFLLAITLFVILDGFQIIAGILRNVFVSLVQNGAENVDPKSLLIALIVLVVIGIRKACSIA